MSNQSHAVAPDCDRSPTPCRLCAADDRAAVIDHVAERLWESHRVDAGDPAWRDAGDYWQGKFRELATTAVGAMGQ